MTFDEIVYLLIFVISVLGIVDTHRNIGKIKARIKRIDEYWDKKQGR